MKKLFFALTVFFMFAIVTSCSKDDDSESSSSSVVVGTWYGDDYDHFYHNVSITFDSNGMGAATMDHSGAIITTCRAQFTYKVKGNTVTTSGTMASTSSADGEVISNSFNNEYEVQGNKLIVKKGNNWYMNNVKSYRK